MSTYDADGTYSDATYVLYGAANCFADNVDVSTLDKIEIEDITDNAGVPEIVIDDGLYLGPPPELYVADGEFVCVCYAIDKSQTDMLAI